MQDLSIKQKYLVTFTVGLDQKNNIDAAVKKVSLFVVTISEMECLMLLATLRKSDLSKLQLNDLCFSEVPCLN